MNESRFHLFRSPETTRTVTWQGIPFALVEREGAARCLDLDVDHPISATCSALFFLGMTTARPECSEWWGQSERHYYQGSRVFIGDRLGRINVVYADGTMETIPVIFGVNLWPYELVAQTRPEEKDLKTYGGPYPEPFASDPAAREILEDSRVLMENDAGKAERFVFGLRVKLKIVAHVSLQREPWKEAGFCVSAITGLLEASSADESWRLVDPDFFLRQLYHPAMDRLARRLYQFRDEVPGVVRYSEPAGYAGPRVRFYGDPAADIFSNVYAHNLHDIATRKVDPDGTSHTSSPGAPNFGLYVGLGTFRNNAASYSAHMWARDVGRILLELLLSGETSRSSRGADVFHRYLYDPCIRFAQPHWKRIINAGELSQELRRFVAGKENDGHAAIMVFIHALWARGAVDGEWLQRNRGPIIDAAQWFLWQMENPSESNFDRVLYSESEASTQRYGGYDLFSNAYAGYAVGAYADLARALEDTTLEARCRDAAASLRNGILERFTTEHPRCGRIFVDTIDDVWTWEYKRFAPLFLLPDLSTYDPESADPELCAIARNTWRAQKEDYFSPAAGRQMGYGQGYLTETALLLDEFEDLSACVEQAALFCYHHSDHPYIVPEGVILHPSGRFWFRNCDLGNAVQQGEIVKCARLVIGLDDLDMRAGLRILPRLPLGWTGVEVQGYPVTTAHDGKVLRVPVSMEYARRDAAYTLKLSAEQEIMVDSVRMGPLLGSPEAFRVNGAGRFSIERRAGRAFARIPIGRRIRTLSLGIEPRSTTR